MLNISWLRLLLTLYAKEWREVTVSRATLLLSLAVGPLVGHAFITAVNTYAEASGVGGGAAALSQGLSPLDGLVVPTFGAYALAVALLYPFVAIRLVSAEKESGALTLMLQSRASVGTMILAKFKILLALWMVLWLPGVVALLLWRNYGGHLGAAETVTVLFGHLLRGALTAAAAMLAAALADGAATAAVITLAVTLGTWALDFVAQIKGGLAERMAAFTPDAALRTFEHGELSFAVIGVTVTITIALLVLCGVWLRAGEPWVRRWGKSGATILIAAVACMVVSRNSASVDVSEDRRNSFSASDEQALRAIAEPLSIIVHLAPEDPRLADLERGVLHKLKRTMRELRITYVSRGGTGLFERSASGGDSSYGEIWYEIGGRRAISRSSIEAIVVSTIGGLARIPGRDSAEFESATFEAGDQTAGTAITADSADFADMGAEYPGWPLKAAPTGAAWMFYFAWPVLVFVGWFWNRRRMRLG